MSSIGKKLALTIGCSYKSTQYQLNGTINDAKNVSNLLGNIGYSVTFMNDNLPNTSPLYPTMNNILNQIRSVLTLAQPGDDVVIFYAGHGIQLLANSLNTPESDGIVESDGQDEALVPVDFSIKTDTKGKSNFLNVIVDDTLNIMLRTFGKQGVRILIICDCCHSGTVCDLKYSYGYNGKISGDISDSVTKSDIYFDVGDDSPLDSTKPIKSVVISLSGCKDEQVSWEDVPSFNKTGGKQGLLTSAFIHTITTDKASIRDIFLILKNVQQYTASYKQNPKVSSNIPLHLVENDNNRYILGGSDYFSQQSNQSNQSKQSNQSNQSDLFNQQSIQSITKTKQTPIVPVQNIKPTQQNQQKYKPFVQQQVKPQTVKPFQPTQTNYNSVINKYQTALSSKIPSSFAMMGSSMNSISPLNYISRNHDDGIIQSNSVRPVASINQHILTKFLL
jgi:hypothetical protein